jgi:hypothetical protein
VHPVRAVAENERPEDDRYPHDDERVGEIERGPRIQVEEVGHVAETDAVDQVRDASAENEAERHRQHGVTSARACEEEQHRSHCDGRHGDDDRRSASEQAERDPGVLDVVDRERPDDVDAFAERERSPDDLLRQLVGDDRGTRDDDENEPLRPSRAEETLCRRDRLEGVRGRADTDVDRR